jgi:hypothetical protein
LAGAALLFAGAGSAAFLRLACSDAAAFVAGTESRCGCALVALVAFSAGAAGRFVPPREEGAVAALLAAGVDFGSDDFCVFGIF